jgi:sarcosine oxidase subunit beta
MSQTQHRSAPIVIIGGGIVGCASAYYLAQRGIRAIILEQTGIAAEGSGRNAGGVRAQCRDPRERALAMASIRLWKGLADELGADIEYRQGGNIRLAATEERLQRLANEGEAEQADGLAVEMWDRDVLRRRAPFLSHRFVGAKVCPTDGHANPILTTWAFAWAAQRTGAIILTRTKAVDIVVRGQAVTQVIAQSLRTGSQIAIETPRVLHAGGPWTGVLSNALGVPVPIKPIRLIMAVTERMPPMFREFLSAHDLEVTARQASSGHVHLSGFGEPQPTFDKQVAPGPLTALHRAIDMVPALASAQLLRTWTGLLDVTPDEIPLIGPLPGIDGYLMAAGFSGHGFCLGPIMGKLLAEWLADGQPSMSLDAFRPDRFADPEQAWRKGTGSSVISGQLER